MEYDFLNCTLEFIKEKIKKKKKKWASISVYICIIIHFANYLSFFLE